MFIGNDHKIGDKTYTIPALSLGQLRNGALAKMEKHDQLLSEGKTFDAMAIRGEVVVEAIRRNYPDVDADEVMNALDLRNITPIWMTVLGASGFLEPADGKKVEAMAAPEQSGTLNPSIAA